MNLFQTIFPILLITVYKIVGYVTGDGDSFDEELLLKPLPSNHVYAYFQFTTIWETSKHSQTFKHSHLFPRGLGEIISRHNCDELHVTMSEGLWRYQKWGYPFHDAGPGAEIVAWFDDTTQDVEREWKGLTNSLAGLLCSSLNFVDNSNTVSPLFSFRPVGVREKSLYNKTRLRYSSLPREIVCTENLTPFKKLLPCGSKMGLGTLLNSAFIHNTNYHSLGLHYRSICRNPKCTKVSQELRQTVSLVYDTSAYDNQDWSIRKFFGSGIIESCPLSTLSNIYVDLSSNGSGNYYDLIPQPPDVKVINSRGGQVSDIGVYRLRNMTKRGIINIAASHKKPKIGTLNYPSILYANRYIIGYGQERGSLVTKIYNNHWQKLDVVLLENIAWYLPVYLHSIQIDCNGKKVKPLTMRYSPGKERKTSYYLELVIRLPPHSVTKFSIDFDYLFLKWQEHPPDANHGFYMGPATITAFLPLAKNYTAIPIDGSTIASSFNATRNGYLVQLKTETLLISLPTPDFSMPYNVICLACTAVAWAFGPLHNISTKRLVLKRLKKTWSIKLYLFFTERIFGAAKTKQE